MGERYVSPSVIRRLPKYHRCLKELQRSGVSRVSSSVLANTLGFTASQVRQDFSCFGGFGQQGYGYNVEELRAEIGHILGADKNHHLIMIGVGNLGRAFSANIDFIGSGFELCAMFDSNPDVIGSVINGVTVKGGNEIEVFCRQNKVDTAVLCVPSEAAQQLADRLIACGITSFWNFTHYDIKLDHPEAVVESVHLSDSLMSLCYQINDIKSPSDQ